MTERSKSTAPEQGGPEEQPALSQMGDTFAARRAAREKASRKAVSPGDAEDKAVTKSSRKS